MDTSSNDYHISFFRPTTPQARANRNMVIWFVLIWAVAIFGFQIALRVLQEPTPEPAYLEFTSVWPRAMENPSDPGDLMILGQTTLQVLCKVAISPEEKTVLDQVLSHSVYQLTADTLRENLIATLKNFEETKAAIDSISDPTYIAEKKSLMAMVSPTLSLPAGDIRSEILPLELTSEGAQGISEPAAGQLPGIMEKYLIHNQSFLTDFRFLGFPFHYFYTAIFLLILFVGLCWLYCVRTDKLNASLGIVD